MRQLPERRTLHWPARSPSRKCTRKPHASTLPGCAAAVVPNRRTVARHRRARATPAVPCARSAWFTVARHITCRKRPPCRQVRRQLCAAVTCAGPVPVRCGNMCGDRRSTAGTPEAASPTVRAKCITQPVHGTSRIALPPPASCSDTRKPCGSSGTVSADARRALERCSGWMPNAQQLSSPDGLSRREAREGRLSARGSHPPGAGAKLLSERPSADKQEFGRV